MALFLPPISTFMLFCVLGQQSANSKYISLVSDPRAGYIQIRPSLLYKETFPKQLHFYPPKSETGYGKEFWTVFIDTMEVLQFKFFMSIKQNISNI